MSALTISITKNSSWWCLEDWVSKNAKTYFGSEKYLKAEGCVRDGLVVVTSSSKMGSIEGTVSDGNSTSYSLTLVEEPTIVTATCSCPIVIVAAKKPPAKVPAPKRKKAAPKASKAKANTTKKGEVTKDEEEDEVVVKQEEVEVTSNSTTTDTPATTPPPPSCHHIAAFLMYVSDPSHDDQNASFGDGKYMRTYRYGSTIPDAPFYMRGNLLASFGLISTRFYATNLRDMMKIEFKNLEPYFKSHPEFILFLLRRVIYSIYEVFKVVEEEGELPVPIGPQFDDSYFTKACLDLILCQPTVSEQLDLRMNIHSYLKKNASTSTHTVGWRNELKRRGADEDFKLLEAYRRAWEKENNNIKKPVSKKGAAVDDDASSLTPLQRISKKLKTPSLPVADIKKYLGEYVGMDEQRRAIMWLDSKLGRSGPQYASFSEGDFMELLWYRAALAKKFQDESTALECVREGMRWLSGGGDLSNAYLSKAIDLLPNKIDAVWKLFSEFHPTEYAALVEAQRVADEIAANQPPSFAVRFRALTPGNAMKSNAKSIELVELCIEAGQPARAIKFLDRRLGATADSMTADSIIINPKDNGYPAGNYSKDHFVKLVLHRAQLAASHEANPQLQFEWLGAGVRVFGKSSFFKLAVKERPDKSPEFEVILAAASPGGFATVLNELGGRDAELQAFLSANLQRCVANYAFCLESYLKKNPSAAIVGKEDHLISLINKDLNESCPKIFSFSICSTLETLIAVNAKVGTAESKRIRATYKRRLHLLYCMNSSKLP